MCARAFVRVYVHACERARVYACGRVRVCMHVCVRARACAYGRVMNSDLGVRPCQRYQPSDG